MNKLILDNSVLSCLDWATAYLEEHKIPDARHNAEEILGFVSGKSRVEIYLDGILPLYDFHRESFTALVIKRSEGYPLQYLLGSVEFFGLNFEVSPSVLIPRPETEILVEKTIDIVKLLNPLRSITSNGVNGQTVTLIDIGTGSGNIAISLAKFLPEAKIYATDISYQALCVAQKNAEINGTRNRISFFLGDIFGALKDERHFFDLIVSNPPYVRESDIDTLAPELSYEPRIALDGKEDGLFYIKKIIEYSPQYLKKGGMLIMEIGFGQAEAVKQIFSDSGFSEIEFIKDYRGIDRVVILGPENKQIV